MPNGHSGSKAEWERITAPLQSVDAFWQNFADRHGLRVTRDARNWPERSLLWSDSLERRIQLYLVDEANLTFTLWIVAWLNEGDRNRIWKRTIAEALPAAGLEKSLEVLLSDAFVALRDVSEQQLSPASE